jgi:energy-coupling factor transporter ATP-binding protein EcfA2
LLLNFNFYKKGLFVMNRQALVVGINEYSHLQRLNAPAQDAEAIAKLLQTWGEFKIWRLPEVQDKENNATRVGKKTPVTVQQLKDKLIQLFQPNSDQIPETALFYFSGHGLRADRVVQEGFLATSDTNTELNNWGLNLEWLRKLLKQSPIRQQIVWLDCCYSGEFLNFDSADPGNREQGLDRFFVAASRGYEEAYEETIGDHGILTSALLKGLDPRKRSDGLITNNTLTVFIDRALKATPQYPLCVSSGNKIILTTTGQQTDSARRILEGVCPYRSLAYFDCNDEDPKYFYGRTALTDELLEKAHKGNFVPVLGASGSGKSSVVRAGLLHQLKLGEKIAGSSEWSIYIVDHPGEHPLQSLARVFMPPNLADIDRADYLRKAEDLVCSGATGLRQIIAAIESRRVVLLIDQFEECFTRCRDDVERKQFIDCLLGAVEQLDRKLCLVLTMRADFFNKCLDYVELAKKIQDNMVTVKSMTSEELREAITRPAEQVGLEVEEELVTQMIVDVESSPGLLPLLQYTLQQLWERRAVNWLTLATYHKLGGVKGTLQQQADAVYKSLETDSKRDTARRIFLALTQVGEGTEDTRRQILKQKLVTDDPQSQALVDEVIQTLSDARLIVTNELLERSENSKRVQVIDIAHEALIRHWPLLRQWIEDNRIALQQQQKLEEAAEEWLANGRPEKLADVLQGKKLEAAEEFLRRYSDTVPLSLIAQQFIQVSKRVRRQGFAKNTFAIIFLATVAIGGFSGLLFWIEFWRFENIIRKINLENSTATKEELIDLLNKADDLKKRIDGKYKYPETKNNADIKYDDRWDNDKDIKKVLQYYRLAVRGVNSNQSIRNDISFARPEESLAKMIHQYRIPKLKEELKNKRIGKWKNYPSTDSTCEEVDGYTPGALRTTFCILKLKFGAGASSAGADIRGEGSIGSKIQAEQIPRQTLKEVNQLWVENLGPSCGWYDPNLKDIKFQSKYEAFPTNCKALDNLNLTYKIFELSSESSILDRLQSAENF